MRLLLRYIVLWYILLIVQCIVVQYYCTALAPKSNGPSMYQQCTKPSSPFCEFNLCELEAVAKALDTAHYPARPRFKLHVTLEAKRYQSKQQQKGGHDIIVSSVSWHTVAAFSCPSEPPPAVAGVAGVDGVTTVHIDVGNEE